MADKPKRDQVNVRMLRDDRKALEGIKKDLGRKARAAGLDPNISDSEAIRFCIQQTVTVGVV